jgi:hypothetical protein
MEYRVYILCPILLSTLQATLNRQYLDKLTREYKAKKVYYSELSHSFLYAVEIDSNSAVTLVQSLPSPFSVLYIHYGNTLLYVNIPIYRKSFPCRSQNPVDVKLFWAATHCQRQSLIGSSAHEHRAYYPYVQLSY